MKASASVALRKAWKSTTGGSAESSSGCSSGNSVIRRAKVAFIPPGSSAGLALAGRGQRVA